jgi:hypothetical protein
MKLSKYAISFPLSDWDYLGLFLIRNLLLKAILVLFDEKQEMDLFNNYFELKEKLEEVFHRQVDLVIDKNFENPFFKKSIEQSRKIIYER